MLIALAFPSACSFWKWKLQHCRHCHKPPSAWHRMEATKNTVRQYCSLSSKLLQKDTKYNSICRYGSSNPQSTHQVCRLSDMVPIKFITLMSALPLVLVQCCSLTISKLCSVRNLCAVHYHHSYIRFFVSDALSSKSGIGTGRPRCPVGPGIYTN